MPKKFLIRSKKWGNHFVIVDTSDYKRVMKYAWHILCPDGKKFYVCSHQGCPYRRLGRFILRPTPKQFVDHINGNTFDNRKCNLRLCSISENTRNMITPSHNTSGYKGVYWNERNKKYRVRLTLNGKHIELGYHTNIHKAAELYNIGAIKYFKQFAKLNHIKK